MISEKDNFPAVPPSLNHTPLETQDYNRGHTRSVADTAPGITPYLGLRARLSQIWFNRWTVLLLLVLVRLMILTSNLHDQLGNAETQALSACTSVENVGSAMASMPHYLSVGVNKLAAEGITKAINGLVDILMLILTGVENLIFFVINMYVGTYVCLIAALIHGGVDLAVAGIDGATNLFNSGVKSAVGDINSTISTIQKDINSVFDTINDVTGTFGKSFSPPKIDISSSLSSLSHIQIDDKKILGDLVDLNSTIPTFSEVEKAARNAIGVPFDFLKQVLNSTYAGYAFDDSVFPVAKKQSMTFCSDNSTLQDFFAKLFKLVANAKIGFIVVLVVLALLVMIPMAWLEIRRWRRQVRHARILTGYGFDPMDVIYITSRPFTATAGIKIASKTTGKRQILTRWTVAYMTSFPALFVLSLAVAGLFSALCQFIIIQAMKKEAPALEQEIGDFANNIVTSLESVSTTWSNDANGVVTNFQDKINDDILGYVTNATSAVNNTLNTFMTTIDDALIKVFNNTPLENTVLNVVNCLIGNKVAAVEQGLTWVHDNAHVTLPLFPNDTFSQGANSSINGDNDLQSFLASPGTVTTDQISAAVDSVIRMLHNNLVQEALTALGLLCLYAIVVLIGLVRSLSAMVTPDKTRAEGGTRYVTADQVATNAGALTGDGRAPLSPRNATEPRYQTGAAATRFPQFAPTQSAHYSEGDVFGDQHAVYDHDMKAGAAMSRAAVPGGAVSGATRPAMHRQKSSHGYLEDVKI